MRIASRQLTQAELELATTRKQRLAVHLKVLAFATELEAFAKKRGETGLVPLFDALQATAHRLKAEIQFERAKRE